MVNLVHWLQAQLDEDERMARAAAEESEGRGLDGAWRYHDQHVEMIDSHTVVALGPENRMSPGVGRHIAEHDPVRVLLELNAKRQILDEYNKAVGRLEEIAALLSRLRDKDQDPYLTEVEWASVIHRRDTLHGVMRLLALPYADRPGYREEWRP
jgi:hypothetical protein